MTGMIRRPPTTRPDTPEEEVLHLAEAMHLGAQSFLYREEAEAAAKLLTGWVAYAQYTGAWDRWIVQARRKSWSGGFTAVLRTNGMVE